MFTSAELDELADLLADRVARRLRWRGARVERPRRDLVAELEVFLNEHPGTATQAIARAIRARPSTVRRLLIEDPRFVEIPRPPGYRGPARCWALTEGS